MTHPLSYWCSHQEEYTRSRFCSGVDKFLWVFWSDSTSAHCGGSPPHTLFSPGREEERERRPQLYLIGQYIVVKKLQRLCLANIPERLMRPLAKKHSVLRMTLGDINFGGLRFKVNGSLAVPALHHGM